MAESEQEWISRRAYALWEEEGYPSGKDTEHWERARQEFVLFAPLGVTKGKGSSKPSATRKTKGNGLAAGDDTELKIPEAATKPAAVKTGSSVKSSKEKTPKPASSKPAALAAGTKPAEKKRSKKLAAE